MGYANIRLPFFLNWQIKHIFYMIQSRRINIDCGDINQHGDRRFLPLTDLQIWFFKIAITDTGHL